jgi:hypothetical protein
MIRPKEKPRPPGLLLGRPGRGYVTQKPTAEMCFHYGPIIRFRHCGIFVKRCRRTSRRRVMTKRPTPHLPPGSAAPADTQEMKEGSAGEAGAFKETSQSRDQGALDARILSQGTTQARRGSRRDPDGLKENLIRSYAATTMTSVPQVPVAGASAPVRTKHPSHVAYRVTNGARRTPCPPHPTHRRRQVRPGSGVQVRWGTGCRGC